MSTHALVITVMLALVPRLAAAQANHPISAGVLAGVNFGSISGLSTSQLAEVNAELGTTLTASGRSGFVLGGFFRAPFTNNKNLAFEDEFLFVQKGGGVSGSVSTSVGRAGASSTVELSYLELPILLKYSVDGSGARPYFFGGPSFDFKLSAKVVAAAIAGGVNAGASIDVSNAIKETDVGIVFGGGVAIGRFLGEARYTLGLTDITTDGEGINNRSFALLGGVRF